MFAGLKASAEFARTQTYEKFKESRLVQQLHTGFPVTLYPQHFKSLKFADTWRAEQRVGLTCSASPHLVRADSLLFIQDFLRSRLSCSQSIPSNALTVSVAMENFSPGGSCHEFVPLLAEQHPTTGAHLSYQMLSKRVQATYYSDDVTEAASERRYLAGICYYPQLVASGAPDYSRYDGLAMEHALLLAEPWPLRRPAARRYVRKEGGVVVYAHECRSTARRVLIYKQAGKRARHYELDYVTGSYRCVTCAMCDEDAKEHELEDDFEMISRESENDEKDFDFGDF